MKKEIDKPYYLIGHSFAGLVMAEMIKIGDPNMKGVVFVDCTYQGDEEIIKARTVFGKSMLSMGVDSLMAETERWCRKDLMGPEISEDDSKMILSSLKYCNPQWMFQTVAACPEFDARYPQRDAG